MPGRSAAKPTSRSGFLAIARTQPVTARLNGSVGLSLALGFGLMLEDMMVSTWDLYLSDTRPYLCTYRARDGTHMVESESHTLHVLIEFRNEFKEFKTETARD